MKTTTTTYPKATAPAVSGQYAGIAFTGRLRRREPSRDNKSLVYYTVDLDTPITVYGSMRATVTIEHYTDMRACPSFHGGPRPIGSLTITR